MRIPIILLASLAAACAVRTPTSVPTDARVDSAFELTIGQPVRLREPDALIQMISVPEDSRCPTDVVCVWAGNGRVRLQVQRGGQTDTLDLNTTLDPHERVVGSLRIKLIALDPKKTQARAIPAAEYRATLVVSLASAPPR